MDNLCHTLVGAALAETGLRRRTRLAGVALVVGANLPDIDAPAAFAAAGLALRRGITHGIPALVVLPFALTGALLLFGRRKGAGGVAPGQLLLLSAIAVVSHPLLDWMNSYGMRWLMPFRSEWSYRDTLFIIDPWLLLLLGAAWWIGRRGRNSGSPERIARGERSARRLVAASAGYVLLMALVTAVGRRVAAESLRLEHPDHRRLMVAPPFLASWRREVIVDAGDHYRLGTLHWLPRPSLELFPGAVPKQLELLPAAPRSVRLTSLLGWARFPFVEREASGLRADDLRYAGPSGSFASVRIPDPR